MKMVVVGPRGQPAATIFRKNDDCNDKGKPAARQGRKAVSLGGRSTVFGCLFRDCLVAESGRRKSPLQTPASTSRAFYRVFPSRHLRAKRLSLSRHGVEVKAGTMHVPQPYEEQWFLIPPSPRRSSATNQTHRLPATHAVRQR